MYHYPETGSGTFFGVSEIWGMAWGARIGFPC